MFSRLILTFSLWWCTSSTLSAQWMELWQRPADPEFIRMDNLFNVYGVSGSEITKYDENGELLFRFSNSTYGSIGDLDVTYPLRPLVFYPALNSILQLDNTLSIYRDIVDLSQHGIPLATLACTSVRNHFWFYDSMNFNLIRTTEGLQKEVETGNLAQILGIKLQPDFMVESNNRLYLNNPPTGILVFDLFGTYIKTIPLHGLQRFVPGKNEIMYFKNDSLHRYDTHFYTDVATALPEECRSAVMREKNVAGICDGDIVVWKWTKP